MRAELAGPESFAIGEATFFNIGTVEGEIARSDDDSLVAISVTWLRSWRGSEKYWGQGALLFIPYDRIDLLEERGFSAGRTAVAAGLGGLALAAIVGIAAALRSGSGNPPGGGSGGTEF